jgi:hypothetical protein
MATTRKTSDKRLLKLADFLDALPRRALNMNSWLTLTHKDSSDVFADQRDDFKPIVKKDNKTNHFVITATEVKQVRECGFAACAAGWACTIPEFNRAGLRLESDYLEDTDFYPEFKSNKGFDALPNFFGIEVKEAYYFFYPDQYKTANPLPTTVAKRIRKFVKDRSNSNLKTSSTF